MENMTLVINGTSREVPAVANLGQLVRHLGLSEARIAVELNTAIIRRKDWETTPVGDQDRVEIVQFVGGG